MAAPGLDREFLARNEVAMLLAALAITLSQALTWAGVVRSNALSGIGFAAAAGAFALAVRNRARYGSISPYLLAWFTAAAFISARLGMRADAGGAFFPEVLPLGLGMALFSVFAARSSHSSRAQIVISCIASAVAMTAGTTFAWVGLAADIHYLPEVCDPVLYHIDARLGFGGALPFAQLIDSHFVVRAAVIYSYKYLLCFAIAAIFSEGFYSRRLAMALPLQFIVSAFCVIPVFAIIPAIGPRFFFGPALFPGHMPAATAMAAHFVLAPVATARNTMPSMHITWALLIWMGLRQSPLWHRALAAVFIGLTVISTLGYGEHYLVDLVSACPFMLVVRAICAAGVSWRAPVRRQALLAGAGLLGLWVAVVLTSPWSLALPWAIRILAAVSVAGSLVLEARLARAELGQARPYAAALSVAA